jgi:Amt family ammonium transporter
MKIDSGDTAFVLISAALVLLMTPGLGFFYGGMVRGKNVVNTLMLSFVTLAVVGVEWVLFGYSEAFAPGLGSFAGLVGSLRWWGLEGVGLAPNPAYAATIPHMAFAAFQAMFAIITPALISGAIVERISFKSYFWFIVLWSALIYAPIAHWVWGSDGWLHNLGALDFAGGTVVHISAGVSALVAALVLGPRKHEAAHGQGHSVPFVLLGAALLWFGWFGFNAGSALGANEVAALAFMTTNAAAAVGALAWMLLDWSRHGKVTAIGAASGAVAGLVAITPAAGYVSPLGSLAIGALAACGCYGATRVLRHRFKIDDSLDAFSVHGVGGMIGAIATGIFATKALNSGGANGLLYGNPHQLLIQVVAVLATGVFAAVGSFIILKVLDAVFRLRVADHVEADGLDLHHHGEIAYANQP